MAPPIPAHPRLQVASGDALGAAPGGQMDVFEDAEVCKDLEVVQPHRRTVVKTGRLEHGSFALLSRAYSSGSSEWRFRLERLSGIVFLGVLEDPHSPRDGLARKLVTPAWMTSSYGYVCTTGGIRGQVARTEVAKKEAGVLSPGALKFGAGDVVTVRLDREARTVSFQIRDLNPFTLRNVSPRARPFVNLASRGDSVTILGAPGAPVELDDAYAPLALPDGPQPCTEVELESIRAEADAFWD